MTSAEAPARRGALARGRRDFRRWRRARPFWGGLFTLLAGIEIFLSGNLSLGAIQFKVGLEGFQSYLIPLMLILAGLLSWFTPAQRIFYGVLAAFISVYSLIGVNLGGFFIGMLLGIVGGSLTAAWAPVSPPQPSADESDEGDENDEDDEDGGAEPPPVGDDETDDPSRQSVIDDLLTGPLTDVLPKSTTSPIPQPRPAGPAHELPVGETDAHAGDDDSDRPGGEPTPPGGAWPRRSPRLFVITLVPLALAAAALATLPAAPPALADPCPAPGAAADTMAAAATDTESTSPTAEPSASASPTPGAGEPSPAPTPSPCPTAAPTSGGPSTGPTAAPTSKSPATPTTTPRHLGAAADQQRAGSRPGRMTGTRVSMTGLTFDGIIDLPTGIGRIRSLQFSMRSLTTDDFQLRMSEGNGATAVARVPAWTCTGNVKFYTSRFTGTSDGVTETFTPESPPPPMESVDVSFTDPDVQLVLVTCDTLTAKPLHFALVS